MTTAEAKEPNEHPRSQSTPGTPIPSAAAFTRSAHMMVTQKTNHVSTVLLYGIPIVSLYIEGQERLCLAQISNTLLKAYSYNEIHNRRVALGITCVQCTPVQLEILRRAGAMPVSSRRCGMITRREAERLCKSFLGDNSPPRLPEDFAFNVQHKCAWGCRGAFLPSRYNSSRAKCIKCAFCGMFFSPNKFIFHSHRVSANDKYVQPDAANFNSWRRHMFLSGEPMEKIVHAWEDVKAMFNGGTRKRLLHSSSSVGGNSIESAISGDHQAAASKEEVNLVPTKRTRKPSSCSNNSLEDLSNSKVTSSETINAMRTAIIVPQRFQQFQADPNSLTAPSLQISGFAPQLMVDYMFQTHHQHQQQQQQQQKLKNGSNCPSFSFSNCTSMPWLKSAACSSPFKCITANDFRGNGSSTSNFLSPHNNNYTVPNLLNTSAFKPVGQQNSQRGKPTINAVASAATFVSSSMYTCGNPASPPTSQSNTINSPNTTSLAFTSLGPTSRILFPTSIVVRGQSHPATSSVKDPPFSDDDENADDRSQHTGGDEDEDEIEVDIETTEDDQQLEDLKSAKIPFPEHSNGLETHNSSQAFGSIYKSRSCHELSITDLSTNSQRPRSRQCSCSSSNDSLYMSSQTKSEKESSSRATSTTSVEILNDDTSNVKPLHQDAPNISNSKWKDIPRKEESHYSFLREPGIRRSQDVLSNMIVSESAIKSQKLSTVESTETNADQQLSVEPTSVPNEAVTLFDTLSASSKNHILTNISNHNITCNSYNSELWQVASLCLHRPQLANNLNSPIYQNRQYSPATQHQQLKE